MSFNIDKYEEILNIIEESSKKTKIVAISKFHPQSSVFTAIEHGVRIFGENRVQEAFLKFSSLRSKFKDLELHLTGPLQTNKVKKALDVFDIFQTLDREKLANEFAKYDNKTKNKRFFIQINTGKELNKSGTFPEQADDFIVYCRDKLKLNIIGVMCIPPIYDESRDHFKLLRNIATRNSLPHISMGMSIDYREAIREGATYIRVGSLLFGYRAS